jgi:hypothetical protein
MKKHVIRNFNTSQYKLVLLILIPLIVFSGCLSIKPSTSKSGKNYFETFFVGEEGTQYFIKPILFKNEKSNEDLILDITFRYRNEIKDSAKVNFSIKSSIIYKTIDSLKFSNKDNNLISDQLVLLYNEKNKIGFTSRFSSKFNLSEIKEMFKDDSWEITIYHHNKTYIYTPHRKTIKAINSVRDRVFVLM